MRTRALAGDAGRQNAVEGRNAVGGDEKQMIAVGEVVNVANLTSWREV